MKKLSGGRIARQVGDQSFLPGPAVCVRGGARVTMTTSSSRSKSLVDIAFRSLLIVSYDGRDVALALRES